MLAFTPYQNVPWPPAISGWSWLLFVYDWDEIILVENATIFVSSKLKLCTGFFPCALQLTGINEVHVNVEVTRNGQFVCFSSDGCTQVLLKYMAFSCKNNTNSLFKMQGSGLNMSHVTVQDCQSDTDGGVVRAYDLAMVVIESCKFSDTLIPKPKFH